MEKKTPPDNSSWLSDTVLDYVLKKSQIFLLVLNPSGSILQANTYAQTIMERYLVGLHLKDVLLSESFSPSLLHEWAERETRQIMNIQTPGNLPRTLYGFVYRIHPGFLLLGSSDGEEMQHLSKEVLQLNQELGNLSRELNVRNRELTHLNALKNQFLGMAAHDLRNPVSVILNYSEFLKEDLNNTLSDQHKQFLDNIFSSAQDMKQVIEDFLDVSIIESGHLLLNPELISFDDLVHEIFQKVRLSAERRTITIATHAKPDLPKLFIDKGKIQQVFINLINNAIEYSSDGGEIVIDGKRILSGLDIAIIDHGKGISKEKQEQLFQEFSGSSRKKRDGERSIGLGLVISKKIIEAHGGTMYVKSLYDEGSTFGFILPESCIHENKGADYNDSGGSRVDINL